MSKVYVNVTLRVIVHGDAVDVYDRLNEVEFSANGVAADLFIEDVEVLDYTVTDSK